MSIYYLYKKTHRKTGLKYLGKTVRNPYSYQGSGTRWANHIKIHGYDVDTEILLETTSKEELKAKGLYYSDLWQVVDSNDWANLRPESGDGGDTSQCENFILYLKTRLSTKGMTYEEMYGEEKATELKLQRGISTSTSRKGKTYEEIFGKDKADELKKARSIVRSNLNQGSKLTEETKNNIRLKRLGVKQTRCSCILCHQEISINNITHHYKIHET